MTNYLNLNKLTTGEPYALYRKAIWVYVFLLIFEGALRKWILPSMATPLLMVREPIVIWLIVVSLQKRWIKSNYAIGMMFVASISFLMTMATGHQDLFVAIFGWRIYFFHFPMIFVIGKVLTRRDLLKIGRFILWLSIPMTGLVIFQFYSPPTDWVNIGVGGEGTAGFSGALGYMRPPGTFSFTNGYVVFQSVVACFLIYYLMSNKELPVEFRFSNTILVVLTGCYIISVPISISRTLFFQTIVILVFLFFAIIGNMKQKRIVIKFIVVGAIVGPLLYYWGKDSIGVEAFLSRYEGANKAEGGVEGVIFNRYIGGMLGAFNDDNPFWGYGLGLGTNIGAKIIGDEGRDSFGFYAEAEWQRIVGECGLLLGLVIILLRFSFALKLFKKAYSSFRLKNDFLPWILCPCMLLSLPQAQLGQPTSLGFTVLVAGLTLSAIKNKI